MVPIPLPDQNRTQAAKSQKPQEAHHEDHEENDEVHADSQSALTRTTSRKYRFVKTKMSRSQKSRHQVLYPETLHPVKSSVRGAKEQDPSVQSRSLITFTPQSVRGEEEPRRQSVYSHSQLSCQVKFRFFKSNCLQFIGRAEQLCQGDPHGGCQAEGRHVSLATRGEGGVTPAHTPSHAVYAKLCRHVVDELHHLCLQLHLQEDVQGGGEASLIHINSAIAIWLYFMITVLVYAHVYVYFLICLSNRNHFTFNSSLVYIMKPKLPFL